MSQFEIMAKKQEELENLQRYLRNSGLNEDLIKNIANGKFDVESLDEYENICYENKMMGQFFEKLGVTPDEITSYVINGSEEDINTLIKKIKS